MTFTDRTLTCADCGAPFPFSADDQAHHAQKGFTNDPKRCPNSRRWQWAAPFPQTNHAAVMDDDQGGSRG